MTARGMPRLGGGLTGMTDRIDGSTGAPGAAAPRATARSRLFKGIIVLCIVLATVGCDQATKRAARERLRGAGTVLLAGEYVILVYAENTGGFLGLGASLPRPLRVLTFIAFPLLVLGLSLAYVLRAARVAWPTLAGFALMLGGGAGNLIDRLAFDGRVTDFINLGIGRLRITGIFNVADLAVMAGCLLLLIAAIRERAPAAQHPPAR
jgi:signal peptidase II